MASFVTFSRKVVFWSTSEESPSSTEWGFTLNADGSFVFFSNGLQTFIKTKSTKYAQI